MPTTKSNPIELTLENTPPEKVRTGVLVVGAFADGTLPPSSQKTDEASKKRLSAVMQRGDLNETAGASLLLYDLPGTEAERILLVSLGKREEFGDKAFRDALIGAAKALATGAAKDAAVTLADIAVPGRSQAWRVREASRLLADGGYRFDAPRAKTDKTDKKEKGARKITLLTSERVNDEVKTAVNRGQAIAEGVALAKDLGNLPGNICNPPYLADTAKAMGKEFNFDVEVLERADMEKLGMGAALSVGRGSAQPCKFIVMHYRGGGKAKAVVLVGKGITFDTGGISLKPGANMDEMKFDMCGAASVFGVVKTVARLRLPINLVGIVPAAENMPGSNATRPGDVVTSMSGQTIEILNTDAEGRLVLADGLTYAERFDPAYVIDIATLTGACVIALGNITTGMFANDEELADQLLASGNDSGDRVWRLPMFDEYQDQLKSNFADMSNLGGRPAGAITAACFLKRFATRFKWAHLDIAGTNAVSGDAKGATGRPVPLLTDFLIARAEGKALATSGVREEAPAATAA